MQKRGAFPFFSRVDNRRERASQFALPAACVGQGAGARQSEGQAEQDGSWAEQCGSQAEQDRSQAEGWQVMERKKVGGGEQEKKTAAEPEEWSNWGLAEEGSGEEVWGWGEGWPGPGPGPGVGAAAAAADRKEERRSGEQPRERRHSTSSSEQDNIFQMLEDESEEEGSRGRKIRSPGPGQGGVERGRRKEEEEEAEESSRERSIPLKKRGRQKSAEGPRGTGDELKKKGKVQDGGGEPRGVGRPRGREQAMRKERKREGAEEKRRDPGREKARAGTAGSRARATIRPARKREEDPEWTERPNSKQRSRPRAGPPLTDRQYSELFQAVLGRAQEACPGNFMAPPRQAPPRQAPPLQASVVRDSSCCPPGRGRGRAALGGRRGPQGGWQVGQSPTEDRAQRPRVQPRGHCREEETGEGEEEDWEYTWERWVQCSLASCGKWRRLREDVDLSALPEHWTCAQNTDHAHNSCRCQEESCDEQLPTVNSSLVPGSLVWAKQMGYPWWPAMVDRDPDTNLHLRIPSASESLSSHCHVTYFDMPVSRAWVPVSAVKLFHGLSSDTACPVCQTGTSCHRVPLRHYSERLRDALSAARIAQSLTLEERVSQLGFWRRYILDAGLCVDNSNLREYPRPFMSLSRHMGASGISGAEEGPGWGPRKRKRRRRTQKRVRRKGETRSGPGAACQDSDSSPEPPLSAAGRQGRVIRPPSRARKSVGPDRADRSTRLAPTFTAPAQTHRLALPPRRDQTVPDLTSDPSEGGMEPQENREREGSAEEREGEAVAEIGADSEEDGREREGAGDGRGSGAREERSSDSEAQGEGKRGRERGGGGEQEEGEEEEEEGMGGLPEDDMEVLSCKREQKRLLCEEEEEDGAEEYLSLRLSEDE